MTIREADTIWHEAGGWSTLARTSRSIAIGPRTKASVGALRVFNDERTVAGAEWAECTRTATSSR